MSLSTGNTVLWSDIQAIYNNLNSARAHLSWGAITVPGNPGLTVPSTVQALKDQIEACRSNAYVNAAGTWRTNITVPAAGTLLKADIFVRMNDTINAIKNTCLFNSANFGSNNGFGSFSSNHGFGSNSFDTFNSRADSSNGSFSVANSFST